MLVRYQDWVRPTDGDFAFQLREGVTPAPRVRAEIREIAAHALTDESAARFLERITRWTGPEDVVDGARPYAVEQRWFEELPFTSTLDRAALEAVLRGTVRVMRSGDRVDYLMRDHHTLDVVLHHYATTGELPRGLFHADRHSDWCTDATLTAKVPQQAATWWALLEGLKRPGDPTAPVPVLKEREIVFCTAQPAPREGEKNVGASLRVPGCVDRSAVGWQDALGDERLEQVDWVSLDLDYFQPARQLRLSAGLIRDERFAALMRRARARLFVLSPQFLSGGDRIDRWETNGSLSSTLRLLNLLRR